MATMSNLAKMKRKNICIHALTVLLFCVSCLFMYDFYKCLSGFIANGFREPHVMLPMVLSYFLPVLCFLVYFYDFYVKKLSKAVKIIYSAIVILLSIVNLVGIFCSFSVYASNNRFGVYETIPSVLVAFPYDGIFFNVFLLVLQVVNIVLFIKPTSRLAQGKEALKQYGIVRLSIVEYLLLCVLAILVFVFVGSAFWAAVNAIENTLYNGKFIFLFLWVLLIPLMNFLLLVFKPETRDIPKKQKALWLLGGIAVNVLFGVLLWIFELTDPSFIVHVGKPFFSIAFSVSLPIEMVGILGIMAISIIVFGVRLALLFCKKEKMQ